MRIKFKETMVFVLLLPQTRMLQKLYTGAKIFFKFPSSCKPVFHMFMITHDAL